MHHIELEAAAPSGRDRFMMHTGAGIAYVDRNHTTAFWRERTLEEQAMGPEPPIPNMWIIKTYHKQEWALIARNTKLEGAFNTQGVGTGRRDTAAWRVELDGEQIQPDWLRTVTAELNAAGLRRLTAGTVIPVVGGWRWEGNIRAPTTTTFMHIKATHHTARAQRSSNPYREEWLQFQRASTGAAHRDGWDTPEVFQRILTYVLNTQAEGGEMLNAHTTTIMAAVHPHWNSSIEIRDLYYLRMQDRWREQQEMDTHGTGRQETTPTIRNRRDV